MELLPLKLVALKIKLCEIESSVAIGAIDMVQSVDGAGCRSRLGCTVQSVAMEPAVEDK